jgi:GNAT superfamily N-acetyltransferase
MEVRLCRYGDPEAEPLVRGLAEEYDARYEGSDEITRTSADEFDPPKGGFVVIVDDGVTVAGGGFCYLAPGVCEMKRMWTRPDHRRQGLATRVLDALESWAAKAGYSHVRLETGPNQPEAAELYGRRYRRISTYGPYPRDIAFEGDLPPEGEDDQ